jgi:hypothetical protein
MTTVLKPSEAMSHGRIMRIKKEESDLIAKQTKEFFKNGGKIKSLKDNESGMRYGAKYNFSI